MVAHLPGANAPQATLAFAYRSWIPAVAAGQDPGDNSHVAPAIERRQVGGRPTSRGRARQQSGAAPARLSCKLGNRPRRGCGFRLKPRLRGTGHDLEAARCGGPDHRFQSVEQSDPVLADGKRAEDAFWRRRGRWASPNRACATAWSPSRRSSASSSIARSRAEAGRRMPCGDIRHVLLSRIRRLFEKTSSDVGLSDDAGQRANLELGMIRHRHRRCGVPESFLHQDVAATLSNG